VDRREFIKKAVYLTGLAIIGPGAISIVNAEPRPWKLKEARNESVSFEVFQEQFIREIAAGFQVPYELLVSEFKP